MSGRRTEEGLDGPSQSSGHISSMAPRLSLVLLLATTALTATSATSVPHQTGLLGARVAHIQSIHAAQANPAQHYAEWLARYGKAYANDLVESSKRFAIWSDNLEYAAQYNARTKSHWIGMNHLADLTQEEYRSKLGFDNAARKAALQQSAASNALKAAKPFTHGALSDEELPLAVDWRKLSAVTPVKNQAQCGSCWAFSTTGAVEGVNAIYTKELVSLSEQELVDCDTEQDSGCSGGLMDYAYQFIIDNKGIDTEEDYPYTAADGTCDLPRKERKVVTIHAFEDVPVNDEKALKKAVSRQPVAVAIEADQRSFQLYISGVYDDEEGCGVQLDHGVLAVGYGSDPQFGPFWIVKNSWGGDWGDAGYIRMKMGASAKEGLCGIAMAASYPIKKGPNPPTPAPTPAPAPGPGPSDPVACDASNECPAATSCCCASPAFGMCLSWGCCPLVKAVCCDDNEHCCPEGAVCDTKHGRCLPKPGGFAESVAWSTKGPAKRTGSLVAAVLEQLTGAKAAKVEEPDVEVAVL